MQTKTKRKNSILLKLGLSLLTVILVGAIVFTTYYFTSNKEDSGYINSLYKYKVKVDKANNTVVDATKNIDNIDIKDASAIKEIKSQVSNASSILKVVLQDIQNIKPPAKYKTQYDTYINGISTNNKIFEQINLILRNTKSNNIESALNSLNHYVTDAASFYETSKLKKASISLPTELIAMPEKVHQYAFKSYNDYQDQTRKLEQYTSYFKSMDDILNRFSNAKVDLSNELDLINKQQISYDEVYVNIENKLSELEAIQNSYDTLTTQPKIVNRHNQFRDIIVSYTNYCQDFKDALSKYEESTDDPTAMADATMSLDDLKIQYKTLSKSFTDYMNLYNGDKSKYSDPDNL